MENPVSSQEETQLQHKAEMPFDPHSDCSLHTPATGSGREGWLGSPHAPPPAAPPLISSHASPKVYKLQSNL